MRAKALELWSDERLSPAGRCGLGLIGVTVAVGLASVWLI